MSPHHRRRVAHPQDPHPGAPRPWASPTIQTLRPLHPRSGRWTRLGLRLQRLLSLRVLSSAGQDSCSSNRAVGLADDVQFQSRVGLTWIWSPSVSPDRV